MAASYRVGIARGEADVQAAQALRFEVFNREMGEGLSESWRTGRDADAFDAVCDHLLVRDAADRVVGTYRMQTGRRAQAALGYYSDGEFDLAPFEPQRSRILELGRACIHREHRNFAVINLLWSGIARYASEQGARYLVGCSSIHSSEPRDGLAVYRRLQPAWAAAPWTTQPREPFRCEVAPGAEAQMPTSSPPVPRLLTAYLALGARICAPPAIDRAFGSIDFLTCLDIASEGIVALQRRGRFRPAG
jgi:putative hemolysin